jgi:hypothetical protein
MAVFSRQDRHFLSSVAKLGYGNPFLPERIMYEKAALGREFVPGGPVWSASVSNPDAEPPNEAALYKKLNALMEVLPARLAAASDVRDDELAAFEESVHYMLYQRYHAQFVAARGKWRFYREFLADWNRLSRIPGKQFKSGLEPARLRLLPPDPARLSSHLRQHHRQLDAGGAIARQHLAIHLHARHAAIPARALSQDGRVSYADHRAVGDRKGANRARHRGCALRAVRSGTDGVCRCTGRELPANQHRSTFANAD